MEDKVRRESKKFLEREFRKRDPKGIGAFPVSCMGEILADLVPGYDEEVMNEMITELKKDSNYVELNRATRKFELRKEKETIDYPSALAIAVHFLVKHEWKASRAFSFSSRALIKLDDLPSEFNSPNSPLISTKSAAKRMY